MIKMETKTALSLGGMALTLLIFMSTVAVKVTTNMATLTVSVDNVVELIKSDADHTEVVDAKVDENAKDVAVLDSKMKLYHQ